MCDLSTLAARTPNWRLCYFLALLDVPCVPKADIFAIITLLTNMKDKKGKIKGGKMIAGGAILAGVLIVSFLYIGYLFPSRYDRARELALASGVSATDTIPVYVAPALDKEAYDLKLWQLANATTSQPEPNTGSSTATSTKKELWPVKTIYPNAGAILPFKRIVAYYGNLYSTKMGVLGEYPEAEMFSRLDAEIKKWEAADPNTPVQPALDYIAATAQESAGEDGDYSFHMPGTEIEKVLAMAKKIDAIVILEVQPGLGHLQEEIKVLEPYLKLPQVHLAIDPEFCMKNNRRPGIYIGSVDASEVNTAANYLAEIVQANNLPPKVLIVHRFTEEMVTNATDIKPLPEVQIVMDMDGWGLKSRKLNTYQIIHDEPVQFTGFKLFYKNDFKEENSRIMTPDEVLKVKPQPIFIQYQ